MCWECKLFLVDQKATKTKENELVTRKCMCKSLGRNSNDAVMGESFVCVFGSRGVKRTLGLDRKISRSRKIVPNASRIRKRPKIAYLWSAKSRWN